MITLSQGSCSSSSSAASSAASSSSSQPSSDSDDDVGARGASPRYVVEAVAASRRDPVTGRREYLIRWAGHGREADSWEPRARLVEDGLEDELRAFHATADGKKQTAAASQAGRQTLLDKMRSRRAAATAASATAAATASGIDAMTAAAAPAAVPTPSSATTTANITTLQQAIATPITPAINPSIAAPAAPSVMKHPVVDQLSYCTPRLPSPVVELPQFKDADVATTAVNGSASSSSSSSSSPSPSPSSASVAAAAAAADVVSSPSDHRSPPAAVPAASVGSSSGRVSASSSAGRPTATTSALVEKKKLGAPSPGRLRANQLFYQPSASVVAPRQSAAGMAPPPLSGSSPSFSAPARRPRSISSEGVYQSHRFRFGGPRGKPSGIPPRIFPAAKPLDGTSSATSVSTSASFSSSSSSGSTGSSSSSSKISSSFSAASSLLLSPKSKAFAMRKSTAIRTPGGHLLTSVTPSPAMFRPRAAGFRQKRGRPLMSRLDGDDDKSFVRVFTPLKKRMKRARPDPSTLKESQTERRENAGHLP